MPLHKRWERYRVTVPGEVRSFAADQTAPFLPSNPFYAKKLLKPAQELVRRQKVLRHASPKNKEHIARGVEKALFAYREKVIFWSIKNAMRAVGLDMAWRGKVWPILRRHAGVLIFAIPAAMRESDLKHKLLYRTPKQNRYTMSRINEAIDRMNLELDQEIGPRQRKQLIHYFSQFYEGGQIYGKTVAHHFEDPME